MASEPPFATTSGLSVEGTPSELEIWYPRIVSELTLCWNHSGIDTYLHKLIMDERHGRRGFPEEIMEELLFLAGVRWHLYPRDPNVPDVDWIMCARRWP
ncbi:hypothetical protein EDC61_11454 [Sulfuritortus calidifontis]|uniref:Uncharacterized protein n=1 Tax=Sulfuritortus calidifontis TaxID=1914471 RepID=A0A4R3JTH4_9PROT|nr:hypothetical protein [Sulfuritortus calidifontis]TCS70727.1 hypothetical protein EDC61_11454 [Sulfuritortus calidifontis]